MAMDEIEQQGRTTQLADWRRQTVANLEEAEETPMSPESSPFTPMSPAQHKSSPLLGPGTENNQRKAYRRQESTTWDNIQTVSFREGRSKYVNQARSTPHKRFFQIAGFVTCAVVGLLTACTARGIETVVDVLSSMRFGFCQNSWYTLKEDCGPHDFVHWNGYGPVVDFFDGVNWRYDVSWTMYVIIGVSFACCSCGLVQCFAPRAAGSGIPEIKTILGGFIMTDVLSVRTLIVKCVGLVLSVSSGMALGKEGPLVHVACCYANILASFSKRYRNNEAQSRELLSAAAAAGVSSAFGAPLGGVLFSLEEVSSFFPQSTLLLCFCAACCASVTLRILTGSKSLTIFAISFDEPVNPWEFPIFVIIGVFGGLVGSGFVAINRRVGMMRNWLYPKGKWIPVLEVFIVGVFTLAVSYGSDILRPLSSHTIHTLFSECKNMNQAEHDANLRYLYCDKVEFTDQHVPKPVLPLSVIVATLLAAFLRWLQMCFTFGAGMPAGLFVPSLFVGACMGRVIGHGVLHLRNELGLWSGSEIYPGAYAMIGAASVLGGVCRVTISLVVIMFELTGGLEYTVPFMVAVLVAKITGDFINHGIYDVYIMLRGYPFLHEQIDITYQNRAVDIMKHVSDLSIVGLSTITVGDLRRKLRKYTYNGYPVVEDVKSKLFVGYVSASRLRELLFIDSNSSILASLTIDYLSNEIPDEARCFVRGVSNSRIVSEPGAVDITDLVDKTVYRMVPDTPLHVVHTTFKQLGLRACFFTLRGELVGLLTKKMFLRELRDGHIGHKREDPAMEEEKARQKSMAVKNQWLNAPPDLRLSLAQN